MFAPAHPVRVDGAPDRDPSAAGDGWTPGRVVALVAGSLLALVSLAFIAGGGALTWADAEQLHSGYLTTGTSSYSTSGYALARNPIDLHRRGACSAGWPARARSREPPPDPPPRG